MFIQNDEILTRVEIFRNIVHPDSNVHQSRSPDISPCLSNHVEYSPDINLVYCTMIASNNFSQRMMILRKVSFG